MMISYDYVESRMADDQRSMAERHRAEAPLRPRRGGTPRLGNLLRQRPLEPTGGR